MPTSHCVCQSVASTSQPACVGLQCLEDELQHITGPLFAEIVVSYTNLRTGRLSISTSYISHGAFQVVASTSHSARNDPCHVGDETQFFDSLFTGAVVSYTSP